MAAQLKSICYVAGHSGGHIIPCLTLAKKCDDTHRAYFITSSKLLDQQIVRAENPEIPLYSLPIGQKRRWWQLPLFALRLFYSFFKSVRILLSNRPEKIVTTGSTIAIPVCIAGWLLGIEIELWELNAIPGNTSRFLSPLASSIKLCFEQAQKELPHKSSITPYPIRAELKRPSVPYRQDDFSHSRITIFIQGGSQGSWSINTLIMGTLTAHPQLWEHIQVVHQAGSQAKLVTNFYKKHAIPACVFSYDHAIGSYYQAADLIICRSGAGSLFEAIHSGKTTITIPLEGPAQSHQRANALAASQQSPQRIHLIRQDAQAPEKLYLLLNETLKEKTGSLTKKSACITI